MKKTMFYEDEINDDFAFVSRKKKEITKDYVFINNNFIYKFFEFITYRLIMFPIAFIFSYIKHHPKFVNKRVLKKEKKGYFLFANHTQIPCDAYFPNILSFPKKSFIIVNPDSLAIIGTETFIKMSGALPIPTDLTGIKPFMDAIEKRVQKSVVVIYPEAHIWPYYTKIRDYKDTSFRYPVKFDKPSFCYTTTYQKRKFGKKPKVTIYVDGPFYPNKELNLKQQQIDLRNRIHEKMVERSHNSTYAYIEYVRREKHD